MKAIFRTSFLALAALTVAFPALATEERVNDTYGYSGTANQGATEPANFQNSPNSADQGVFPNRENNNRSGFQDRDMNPNRQGSAQVNNQGVLQDRDVNVDGSSQLTGQAAVQDESGNSTVDGSVQGKADNTAMNARDRDHESTLTPLDQGKSRADIDTTASIRKSILGEQDMSVNAQNVKIITQAGKVTLRGPVRTAQEKDTIFETASRLVSPENVNNQLEVIGEGRLRS